MSIRADQTTQLLFARPSTRLACPPLKRETLCLPSCLVSQEVTTPVGQYAYASPVLLESRGLSEADRESTKVHLCFVSLEGASLKRARSCCLTNACCLQHDLC